MENIDAILDVINEDENVDIIVMEMPSFIRRRFPVEFERNLQALFELKKKTAKPLAVITPAFSTIEEFEVMQSIGHRLLEKGIPSFPGFQRGARALRKVAEYYQRSAMIKNQP